MKNLVFRSLLLVLSVLLASFSVAEIGHLKGKVQNIRIHDGNVHQGWTPPVFWFTLKGVSSAGKCKLWNGNVLFVMETEAAYSLILATQMADKEIAIRYDDTVLNSGQYWCKATYITTGNPAPLY